MCDCHIGNMKLSLEFHKSTLKWKFNYTRVSGSLTTSKHSECVLLLSKLLPRTDNTFEISKNQINGIWYIVVLSNTAIPHFNCASLYNTWQALYCVFFYTLKVWGNCTISKSAAVIFPSSMCSHVCLCHTLCCLVIDWGGERKKTV